LYSKKKQGKGKTKQTKVKQSKTILYWEKEIKQRRRRRSKMTLS